jgi:hypothetical protein
MSQHAYLSTRKGLFELAHDGAAWQIGASHFLGEPVSFTLADGRDGSLYAALNLGHFGVKLQRRDPGSAALAVTRTSDGGNSFCELRNGLPQRHCYDLVYRHGLAVADDGRGLLMGSTSGGVWVSTDAGDSWQTVSTTMPPVYAVCFG